jgi:hypothetical protein
MSGPSRHWLVLIQLLPALAISTATLVLRLSQEAELALGESDTAFDAGELKRSTQEAHYALNTSIADSQNQKRSIGRLAAIAAGSEATGRHKTAILAWSCLHGATVATSSTLSISQLLVQRPEQHLDYLLDRVAGEAAIGAASKEPPTELSAKFMKRSTGSAKVLIVAGLVVGIVGFMVRFRNSQSAGDSHSSQKAVTIGLHFAAVFSWCIGWIIA